MLRKIAEYTLFDHKRNEEIIQKLQTTLVIQKVTKYKTNWIHEDTLPPNFARAYQPRGKRRIGTKIFDRRN